MVRCDNGARGRLWYEVGGQEGGQRLLRRPLGVALEPRLGGPANH